MVKKKTQNSIYRKKLHAKYQQKITGLIVWKYVMLVIILVSVHIIFGNYLGNIHSQINETEWCENEVIDNYPEFDPERVEVEYWVDKSCHVYEVTPSRNGFEKKVGRELLSLDIKDETYQEHLAADDTELGNFLFFIMIIISIIGYILMLSSDLEWLDNYK